jgi:hypothetical protein
MYISAMHAYVCFWILQLKTDEVIMIGPVNACVRLSICSSKRAVHFTYQFLSFFVNKNFFSLNTIIGWDESREEMLAAIQEGEQQLNVLKRQVIIGNLYPSGASVMESMSSKKNLAT